MDDQTRFWIAQRIPDTKYISNIQPYFIDAKLIVVLTHIGNKFTYIHRLQQDGKTQPSPRQIKDHDRIKKDQYSSCKGLSNLSQLFETT